MTSGSRCSCGRRTCSADGRWRSCTAAASCTDISRPRWPRCPPKAGAAAARCSIDRYLFGTEVDVDAISDGETVVIPGLMEHVERAGVHSGDSMAAYPARILSDDVRALHRRRDGAHHARARRSRSLQHPVRGAPWHSPRARGQSACLAHRAVPEQGDRCADGRARHARDAWCHARRARMDDGTRSRRGRWSP